MEIPLVTPGKEEEPRRKVLDQSQVMAEAFDEDVLAEIERRLDREEGPVPGGAGEKVELDKADLPILEMPVPQAPPPEVEVDLAGEAPSLAAMPVEAPTEEEAPASKKRLGLFLGLGAGVALLAVGAVGAWLYLKKPAPAPAPAPAPVASLPAETPAEKPPEARPELNYKLEPFLVPLLKSKDGGRLLLISLSLEVGDPKVRDLLNPRKVAMRDLIYRLLRDRPADEIKSARTKHLLETQIKTELNHYLGTEVITQVRFTDFVITG